MSEQAEQGNERAKRRAELEAELAALDAESEEEVSEAIEEAAEEVDEVLQEAAEEAAEVIEEETGETLSPDDIRILKGLIAQHVAGEAAPEVELIDSPHPEEVAEAVVEPDSAPVRTHWTEKRVF